MFFEHADLAEDGHNVFALLLNDPSTLVQHEKKTAQLRCRIAHTIVHAEQLADLGKGQAQPFAPQDEAQPSSITLGIDAVASGTGRGQKPFVLVEADGPWRDAEFTGKFGNGVGFFLAHGSGAERDAKGTRASKSDFAATGNAAERDGHQEKQENAAMPPTLDYPFDTLPPGGETREVAPGVHWIRMPLPFALDHINLWLIEDGEGVVIVDTGYGLEATQDAWNTILTRLGRPVTRIIVTHCHPDHLGLAQWLAEKTGAPITMTLGEFLGGHALWHPLPGYNATDMVAQFRQHGLDEARCDALARRGNAYKRGVPSLPSSYDRVIDGDVLEIGGHDWKVIVGYGHSPEHMSLHCESAGILISGDMLLPRISTNVSVFAATPDDDPLGRFLESIRGFKQLPAATLVLPSHGSPFRNIGVRVDQLVEHHADRCAELLAACAVPHCAGELLATLFPRELDTHQVMFAMGEAIAHLNHLARKNEVCRSVGSDGIVRFIKSHQ